LSQKEYIQKHKNEVELDLRKAEPAIHEAQEDFLIEKEK
jgi:hypothetical protein